MSRVATLAARGGYVIVGLAVLWSTLGAGATAAPGPVSLEPPTNVSAVSYSQDSVSVMWSPSTDPKVQGYRLYIGAENSPLSLARMVQDTGSSLLTVTGLDPEGSYYFVVTAVDSEGYESPPSQAVWVAGDSLGTAQISLGFLNNLYLSMLYSGSGMFFNPFFGTFTSYYPSYYYPPYYAPYAYYPSYYSPYYYSPYAYYYRPYSYPPYAYYPYYYPPSAYAYGPYSGYGGYGYGPYSYSPYGRYMSDMYANAPASAAASAAAAPPRPGVSGAAGFPLGIRVLDQGVEIMWPALDGARSYSVVRCGAGSCVPVASTSATTYLDTGVAPGTTYSYTVMAFGSGDVPIGTSSVSVARTR